MLTRSVLCGLAALSTLCISCTQYFVCQLHLVHPRRIYRAVDSAIRLSLYEEALRIVTHVEQIDAFCIGG